MYTNTKSEGGRQTQSSHSQNLNQQLSVPWPNITHKLSHCNLTWRFALVILELGEKQVTTFPRGDWNTASVCLLFQNNY